MASIHCLPREILIKIFKCYLETENQKNLLRFVSKVSKEWANLCQHHLLWQKFDGTLSNFILRQLSSKGILMQTEELIFSYSKVLKCKALAKILSNVPHLKSIDFSNVQYLQKDVFNLIGKFCPKLCALKLSSNSVFSNYIISLVLFDDYFKIKGHNLITIDLSHTVISNLRTLLNAIVMSCHNLEQLFLQNIKHASKSIFPLETFQTNCPKMKVLCLNMRVLDFTKTHGPGFLQLEEFSYSTSCQSLSNTILLNILSKSFYLKSLEIRCCTSITVHTLMQLPTTSLQNLNISVTNLFQCNTASDIFVKWSGKLVYLYISGIKSEFLNDILQDAVAADRLVNLECLDLSNTTVSIQTVVQILEGCKKLRVLDLSACRKVGRGKKREYHGRMELEGLLYSFKHTDN